MPATPRDIRVNTQPALATDLVLMTIRDRQIMVLVQKRHDARQVGGDWALPGTIVRLNETLEQAVQRVLHEKAGLREAFFEQLQTFSALDRDPRGRVVTVAYYALVPEAELTNRMPSDTRLFPVQYLGIDENGPLTKLQTKAGKTLTYAFDHARIVGAAIARLRAKLDYTTVGLELLPRRFTLRDLQGIHETILETKLTKPAFRRKILDRKHVKPTGRYETGRAFRPAELYERNYPGDIK
jgi:ADP-ribose pyrophosphatase YjhB (NUDIX family)